MSPDPTIAIATSSDNAETHQFPSPGDLLLCTVKIIHPHCAFVTLNEYAGLEGMIHISEVSSSWIKNIRNHVREGKKIVCKVMRVDVERGHINLSIRRVTEFDRREKFNSIKRANRVEKMMERISTALGATPGDVAKIIEILTNGFTEAYFAFEDAARNGPQVLIEKKIPKEWAEAIAKIAAKNITFPLVEVSGMLMLTSMQSDGVDQVRGVLTALKNAGLIVQYVSAPNYNVTVKGGDYKSAERKMKTEMSAAIEKMKALGGMAEFTPHKKK